MLLSIFPAVVVTIASGQNAFLTGSLIGLACLALQSRRAIAGLPIGLMIIKPHLAVTFALFTLVTRRWDAVVVAALVVVTSSAFSTLILGPSIWLAVSDAVREAKILLEAGFYPLCRIVSVYAGVRSLGFSAVDAGTAQVVVGTLALLVTSRAVKQLTTRQALGFTSFMAVMLTRKIHGEVADVAQAVEVA